MQRSTLFLGKGWIFCLRPYFASLITWQALCAAGGKINQLVQSTCIQAHTDEITVSHTFALCAKVLLNLFPLPTQVLVFGRPATRKRSVWRFRFMRSAFNHDDFRNDRRRVLDTSGAKNTSMSNRSPNPRKSDLLCLVCSRACALRWRVQSFEQELGA